MGLDAIVSAIASEAAAQVERTKAAAEVRVAEILDEAGSRAEAERTAWAAERDDEAERAAARITNRARLEADRHLAQAREDLFQQALVRLRSRLEAIVAGPEYERILVALYEEAITALREADATILVRASDRERIERIVADHGRDDRVSGSLVCAGGVDAEAGDGRAARNTIDARLHSSERQLRHLAVQSIPEFATQGEVS